MLITWSTAKNNTHIQIQEPFLHDSSVCPQSFVKVSDDGKLVHVQKWDGKETSLVRSVEGNALTLVSALTAPVCTVRYVRCSYCALTALFSLFLSTADTYNGRCCLHTSLRESGVKPARCPPKPPLTPPELSPADLSAALYVLHTVRSVLTLRLTGSCPLFFSLCCLRFCKRYWINSNDLLLFIFFLFKNPAQHCSVFLNALCTVSTIKPGTAFGFENFPDWGLKKMK